MSVLERPQRTKGYCVFDDSKWRMRLADDAPGSGKSYLQAMQAKFFLGLGTLIF
jgi:hypothetical protein